MNSENILIITGDQIRHKFFARQLNARFPIQAVFHETFQYPEPAPHSREEEAAWKWFFNRRHEYELNYFDRHSKSPLRNQPEQLWISPETLNSPETLARLESFHPGLIVLHGTSLLGPEILTRYSNSIFNLHVGIPGYCRGSSCNFWPIHNEELEFLGATVHRVDSGIDTGKILAQGFIEIDEEDDEQTLGGKTLILGIRLMQSAIENWRRGNLHALPKGKKGPLYLRKDFTPAAVLKVRKLVESGELKKQIQKVIQKRGPEFRRP